MSGGGSFSSAFPILYAADVSRVAAFYRELLGFEEAYRFPRTGEPGYVALRLGESRIGIGVPPDHLGPAAAGGASGGAPRFELCVYVDDTDAAIERLRAHGVRVLADPADQLWGERNAYVEDPQGNRIHIASRP